MATKKSLSVLIVDDAPVVRDAVKIILAQRNYAQIHGEAGNGQEAVEMADIINPDMILMDVDMPRMNGVQAAKAIRQKHKEMKIVMLTSCHNEVVIFNSFAAGADGYILKDKFPDTIEAAITTVRLGSVWLDPAIARRILELAGSHEKLKDIGSLTWEEIQTLNQVANCNDNYCLVDPGFVVNLRRLAPSKSA